MIELFLLVSEFSYKQVQLLVNLNSLLNVYLQDIDVSTFPRYSDTGIIIRLPHWKVVRAHYHRSDSIQGTDYIATPIEGFLGQKFKI